MATPVRHQRAGRLAISEIGNLVWSHVSGPSLNIPSFYAKLQALFYIDTDLSSLRIIVSPGKSERFAGAFDAHTIRSLLRECLPDSLPGARDYNWRPTRQP